MAETIKYSIVPPHDPETNLKTRESLDYYVTLPAGYDPSQPVGLVFCITGYGDTADSEYQAIKLRPYIADKHNMITVGVRYHNDAKNNGTFSINLQIMGDFYGVDLTYLADVSGMEWKDEIYKMLVEKGLSSTDPRLAINSEPYHQYSSFGFLPAMDHLHVLADILGRYKIDRKKIIAFGTSYGGYIACLMAKYAPHTFSMVIENSGFCVTELTEVMGTEIGGVTGSFARVINNRRYEILLSSKGIWSIDETNPYYFSDSHKQIRSLLIQKHRIPSGTVYFSYHCMQDIISSIQLKDIMCEGLKVFNTVYYQRVTEKDIDGRLFKSFEHSMNASLRGLFDLSYEKYQQEMNEFIDKIDFELEATYEFICSDKIYQFSYSSTGVEVSIKERE